MYLLVIEKHISLFLILGKFSHEDKQYSGKSDENQFFCQIHMNFFRKKTFHFVTHRYFSLFLKGLEDIS